MEGQTLLPQKAEKSNEKSEPKVNRSWVVALFVVGCFCAVVGILFVQQKRAFGVNNDVANYEEENDDLHPSVAGQLRRRLLEDHTMLARGDYISKLPGLKKKIKFLQFSGYIDLDENKRQFYWLTEADESPEDKPIVFWTNGGPGCSGLLGFLTEMGAFRVKSDMTLKLNPHSWNKVANMLYVEQPVGVGFSYKKGNVNDESYYANDRSAAEENHAFLKGFFDKYPSFAKNDLYLTAESYGGHYIPTLAKYVVEQKDLPNFKGIMVGNPYTDPYENLIGAIDTFWGHQLLPQYLYEPWASQCHSSSEDANNDKCTDLEASIFSAIGKVKPYALDFPVCNYDHSRSSTNDEEGLEGEVSGALMHQQLALAKHLVNMGEKTGKRPASFAANLVTALEEVTSNHYEACAGYNEVKYLNQDTVKRALHAHSEVTWAMCSDSLTYDYYDSELYIEPTWEWLALNASHLRLLVYSGDDDSVCGTIGTQMWIGEYFGQHIKRNWMPWRVNGQLAGYSMALDKGTSKLFFATVHGAGHEVPAYKPSAALHLFRNFINGTLLSMVH